MFNRKVPVLAFALVAAASLALAEESPTSVEKEYGRPRKHSWEFSPFAGVTKFDTELDLDDGFTFGARIGWNWTPHWETELGFTWVPDTSFEDSNISVESTAWDLNMTANLTPRREQGQNFSRWMSRERWIPYFTVGVGQNQLSIEEERFGEATEETANFGVGTRLMMNRVAGLRLDLRGRWGWDSDVTSYEATLGGTFILGATRPVSSDCDGVPDGKDRCPETPCGCWVDEFGCPRDTDADGVCDGIDQCPDTPRGCRVDEKGCPLDGDGDTVCDGLDNCPSTPRGCWVDEVGCEKDSDEDGVCDGVDQCPNTRKGCRVNPKGCPLDEDGDTVCDGIDECPGTPAGTPVDEKGCPYLKLVLADVNFEFDRFTIRPFFYPLLDEVARSLQEGVFRSVVLELAGHTDNLGSNHYNFALGNKRAEAVKAYLVSRGIEPHRISTTSYGETRPKASNETDLGRWANRRVEMEPHGPNLAPSDTERYAIMLRDILFDSGKADLKPESHDFLDQIALALQKDRFRSVRLKIEGHAYAEGKKSAAEGLSVDRAQAVKEYLVGRGIEPGRIEIEGLGATQPKKGAESDTPRQRRATVGVVGR